MKRSQVTLTLISLILLCAMAVNLSGCAMEIQAQDLMAGVKPNKVNAENDLNSRNADVTDFAIRLFRASVSNDENVLISPLSVLCALAMTANGAQGQTLNQMERVLGMTSDELNEYIYSYMSSLPSEKGGKLSLANSVWFTEAKNFTVNQDFLQKNADYYSADIYKAPFDISTCRDINNWVNQKTDGMIPNIIDNIPADAIMYLVNALAFDAEWSKPYEDFQVRNGEFTKEDGTVQDAEFMYGDESVYLEDENAVGFMKYYAGGKYAFVAMLPNEGVSVSEYIASVDDNSLNALLNEPKYTKVLTSIPKFETEYGTDMSEILAKMGMTDAFDAESADFSGIGTSEAGNISISSVIHKTYISVAEKGTKAGAATLVEMKATGADIGEPEFKEVYLDRPFVYMLVDCNNNIPFFIGTMIDVQK